MKYERPEVTALTAIDVIQSVPPKWWRFPHHDNTGINEITGAYEDWE